MKLLHTQRSVTAETTSTTRIVTATEVVFATTTLILPSCPCPCTGLATGSTFTSTLTTPSVPSASVVALHIDIFPTDGTDPENLFLNVDGDRAVADVAPILLYFNDNAQIAEAENLNNLLFLSLTSSISTPKRDSSATGILRRQDIFGFYPVYLGTPFEGTTTQNFFINDQGKVNLRYQNETGSVFVYEIALCRVDGLLSRQVYMHEVDVEYPPECYPADAYLVTDEELTSSITSMSRTRTRSTMLSISTSSPTQITPTTTSSTTTSSSSSSSMSTSSSSASTESISRGTTTVTIYTEDVLPGSVSTTATSSESGLVTVTEYLPYPSSLIVLAYENENAYEGFLNAYLEQFLVPVLEGDSKRLDYRVFVLTSEGWLMNPISGPKLSNDVWDGAAVANLEDPRYVYVREETISGATYPRLSIDTLSNIATNNGQLLTFEVQKDGTLVPKSSSNVTAGNDVWVCANDDSILGFTDGTNSACSFGKITNIQIRGRQETVTASTPGYDFITAETSTLLTIGVGPTVTAYKVLPRDITTETVPITSGEAGRTTVSTAFTDPTATVTFNQYMVTQITSVWGRTTGDPQTTTIVTDDLTKTVSIEYAYPLTIEPVSMYDYWGHPFRISEATETPVLQGYRSGSNVALPETAYTSLWTLIDKALVVTHMKSTYTEFFGTEPHYGFYNPVSDTINFYNMSYGVSDTSNVLLTWDILTQSGRERYPVFKRWIWLTSGLRAGFNGWNLYGCGGTAETSDMAFLDPTTEDISNCVMYATDLETSSRYLLYWDMVPGPD
ncbi:hypothetical protein TWF281_007909 [Arthrobotrys megalospora]